MPRRLLETHVPDADRHCLACTDADCEPVSWPCPIRSLALDAFVMQRRIPPGAVVVPGIDDSML
jgi:hypothetical protein